MLGVGTNEWQGDEADLLLTKEKKIQNQKSTQTNKKKREAFADGEIVKGMKEVSLDCKKKNKQCQCYSYIVN